MARTKQVAKRSKQEKDQRRAVAVGMAEHTAKLPTATVVVRKRIRHTRYFCARHRIREAQRNVDPITKAPQVRRKIIETLVDLGAKEFRISANFISHLQQVVEQQLDVITEDAARFILTGGRVTLFPIDVWNSFQIWSRYKVGEWELPVTAEELQSRQHKAVTSTRL